MVIGEIQEVGVIEPLVVPEDAPESAPAEHETEQPMPRRVEEPVPAR
jgi:hypothetical protein